MRTISEIADCTGKSKRHLRARANKEAWAYKEVPGVGGQGKKRFYLFDKLPADIKKKVISHQIGCHVDFVPSKNLNISNAWHGLKKWKNATKYNRKIAQARYRILKELSKFITSKGLKKTEGKKRFASRYDAELIKIEPWIYEEISSISAPTLAKWIKKEKEGGLPGLLGGHGNRKGESTAFTPEHRAFVVKHIAAKPHIRPVAILKLLRKTFDDPPSRRTVYRKVEELKKENPQLFALVEDPRRWKNKYQPAFGNAGADVPHFGHTLELDSTPADVITKDGRRNAVIGAICNYSRRAIIVIAPTSKAIAIAATIRKVMIAWGISSRFKMDNGAEYQSLHVQATCSALKIQTPELPKYSPEKKPFIERFFGTFSRGFEELLPGYCGHSVNERQALREKETWSEKIMRPGVVEVPLTMEEFQNLADRWIKIYENTPHKGLGGKTPLEKAKESHLQPPKIRDVRTLDILLAPIGYRTVQKKGIGLDNHFFVSPELVEYIGHRVEIRRDLNNAGLLYVFDTSGKYLCQARNEPLEGQALEDYLTAKKEHLKGIKGVKRALEKMGVSNKTAIQTLLEDEIEDDNVIPLQFPFENQAVREAKKAVEDTGSLAVESTLEQVPKAVNYYSSTDFLLDDSHMTDSDIDREYEEIKKYRNKRIL